MKNIEKRDKIILDYYDKVEFYLWDRNCEANRENKIVYLNKKRYEKSPNEFLFALLHEIGHIENNVIGCSRSKAEYDATDWAIKHAEQYKVKVTDNIIDLYQNYIYDMWDLENLLGSKKIANRNSMKL